MSLTFEEYLQNLKEADLLTQAEIDAALADFSEEEKPTDGESLAAALVNKELMTAYQAQVVFRGKGHNLTLGNYIIQDKLGQGGMGMVFRAKHRNMKREVALKVVSGKMTKDKEMMQRFHREVEAAAKLNHPNIVVAHDADESQGPWYLVMEVIDGKDLSAIVKKKGPVSIAQAAANSQQYFDNTRSTRSQGEITTMDTSCARQSRFSRFLFVRQWGVTACGMVAMLSGFFLPTSVDAELVRLHGEDRNFFDNQDGRKSDMTAGTPQQLADFFSWLHTEDYNPVTEQLVIQWWGGYDVNNAAHLGPVDFKIRIMDSAPHPTDPQGYLQYPVNTLIEWDVTVNGQLIQSAGGGQQSVIKYTASILGGPDVTSLPPIATGREQWRWISIVENDPDTTSDFYWHRTDSNDFLARRATDANQWLWWGTFNNMIAHRAFQISTANVPEPGSMALLSLISVGGIGYRRRKSKI